MIRVFFFFDIITLKSEQKKPKMNNNSNKNSIYPPKNQKQAKNPKKKSNQLDKIGKPINQPESQDIPYSNRIQSILIGDMIEDNIDCAAKNTHRKGKICVCDSGYPYGDPSKITGCYNCINSCHKKGFCKYPGKCTCQPGYKGDGIESCNALPPKLSFIFPETGFISGGYQINVTYVPEPYNYSTGFLRMGSLTIECNIFEKGLMICDIPPVSFLGTVKVSASFDEVDWSSEFIEFSFVKPHSRFPIVILVILAGFIGCIFIFFAISKFISVKRRSKNKFSIGKLFLL